MNVSVNKQLMSYQNCFIVLSRICHKNGLKAVFSFQFHRRCPPAKLLSGPAMVCVCVCVCACSLHLPAQLWLTSNRHRVRSVCVCVCDSWKLPRRDEMWQMVQKATCPLMRHYSSQILTEVQQKKGVVQSFVTTGEFCGISYTEIGL